MGVGQQNKNVIFIIQARMNSSRLPGKILLPIPLGAGKPILKWITDTLKKSKHFKKIYIASSNSSSNDSLNIFCEKEEISLYRGSENDVLSRFLNIVTTENSYSVIVRLTGDNPIIDILKLDEAISKHLDSNVDYTYTSGLPLGMNFEIINSNILLSLKFEKLTFSEKEHVTLFIKNNNKFSKQQISFSNNLNTIRATIDYPNDFVFISSYLEFVLNSSETISSDSIQNFVNSYPWISEVNAKSFQKKEFNSIYDEIKEVLPILEKLEFKYLVSFFKKYDFKKI